MRARGEGMRRDVQRSLGVIEDDAPKQAAPCTCGGDRIITTDGSVFLPGLARIGRMIDYCNNCNGIMRIYPGPKMLTRDDKEAEYEFVKRGDGVVYRRAKRATTEAGERNRRHRKVS